MEGRRKRSAGDALTAQPPKPIYIHKATFVLVCEASICIFHYGIGTSFKADENVNESLGLGRGMQFDDN